jgi:UDP-glucose 4-epimerase
LIAKLLEATRDDEQFRIYGDNYPTDDGTCVRDYVHVDDIAQAHVLALYMRVPPGVYNLGSNQGTSVKQVMERAKTIVGKMPHIGVEARREGDPPVLVASADKYDAIGWRKNYTLDDMIQHSWNWYTR